MQIEISGLSTPNLALELIDVQDASFGLILEKHIESLISDIHNKRIKTVRHLRNRSEIKNLETIILERLGIKVKIKVVKNVPAAAVTPKLGVKNIADYKRFRKLKGDNKEAKKIFKLANESVVDSKKAKISGAFSELDNELYLNVLDLVNVTKLNTKEIVGVMLHELGHIFTYYEYITRLNDVNVVLEDSLKVKSNKDLKKPETIIYKEFKNIGIDVDEEIVKDLISGKSIMPVLAIGKIYSSVITSSYQASYGDKNSERLADLFSNRFGYGADLAKGLEKIYKTYNVKEIFEGLRMFQFMQSVYIAAIMIFKIGFVISNPGLANIIIAAVDYIVFFMVLRFFNSTATITEDYDKIKTRYIKIRNDTVRFLKDSELDVDDKKSILDNIAILDEIINKSTTLDNSLTNILFNYLSIESRRFQNKFDRQELLESLEANDLFIQAAELS